MNPRYPKRFGEEEKLVEKVAMKVGEPPITMIVNEGKINPATYLRARIFLNLNKPLIRVVSITLRECKKYLVQYEKLPIFCSFCRLLDHEVMEY
jgi:CRISPR/Cas system-associated protein Cas5 (RAMP superfamily)